ncbi:hypothetical protein ACJRO7_014564 [Eucalyptus globulus]|uniref:TIR domain-containing protein n=1 Tax=Eucalyptus globulus TaxID=34317 RepID=A0ABD3L4I8_EUCGL
MIRKEPPHSEDLPYRASSSSTSPHVGDNGGTKRLKEESEYEVFLSFRGEDTRKGFTGHLYTSLVDAGIRAYRDNDELRVGDEIGTELLRSITQSKISIPIISEDYASSKWCLQELAQMLKCRKSGEQVVLPIFYKVKPSQVRDPKGKFGDAINAHKKNLGQEVVKEWEEALNEVSSLKGWESEKIDDGYEATLVKMVGIRVMGELKRLFDLSVPEQLVGTDDSVEQIMSKIDANFNGTWIIGIHGMGGIGKTTLAKVLYNKLFSNFENRSFVADIRERSQHNGIVCLQNELISNVIRGSEVSNVDDGIRVLKSRCKSKKVLALLDDMDDTTHLDALVGDGSWFKVGSIVIITTRNKSILDKVRASHLYELEQLPPNQSLILFSRHAFRDDSPSGDCKHISHDIVSITGGLPLALEVIGSYLCGKTKATWKDTSEKLKKIPAKEVQKRLKISYDALDCEEQQIFLDIACFFIGSFKEYPTYMWDACNFYPGKGIEVLSLMSLIKVSKGGMLMMHDQLRDLGREIVRLENQKEPGERSRLWIDEEAKNVLESNKGTCKIEALCLGYSRQNRWESDDEESYRGEQFNEFTNLRFLQLGNMNFTGDFQNLLPQLRWLDWVTCPSHFEIVNFHPKKLVVLNLSSSEISEDWGGWGPLKVATNLKVLDLSWCKNLRRTPNLSAFESLEILNLDFCSSLEEIHPSIWYIKTLVSLDAFGCHKLEKLPVRVGRMEESRELPCYDKLAQLPKSMGSFESLTRLNLSVTGIKELPEFIGSMKALETLYANGYKLDCIPNSIGNLTSLTHLDLSFCSSLREIPNSIGKLAKLQVLHVNKCKKLEGLPSDIGELVSLNKLYLEDSGIRGLPESISKLSSVQCLDVRGCKNLREIPTPPLSLTALHIDFRTPSLPFLSKLTLLQELTLFNLRPLECLSEFPVRLLTLHIKPSFSLDDDPRDLEKRLSELIRDKSSGRRELTGSNWTNADRIPRRREGRREVTGSNWTYTGRREVTGSNWTDTDFIRSRIFISYQIGEATNPTIAKSSEEGDPLFDEAASPGTLAVATSSEEGDTLSLSLSLSWPYKFRRPNPAIAKPSEEGDPLSLSLALSPSL